MKNSTYNLKEFQLQRSQASSADLTKLPISGFNSYQVIEVN